MISAICILTISCDQPAAPILDVKKETLTEVQVCYQAVRNRDTVVLKTFDSSGVITGTLAYNYFEKDKNQGTIKGKMQGDLLIADYNFLSEGVLSSREVVFKKQGRNLIEGYGSSREIDGRRRFTHIDSLDFSQSWPLVAIDCK